MSEARNSPGKECSPFPENFDRDLYGFRDDFSLWMSALARRVALKKDIDSLSELHSVLQDDFSEQRSALYSACRLDCQNKVMALINEPIPANEKPFEALQIGVACSEHNGNERWHLTVDGGSDHQIFYGHSALANHENYLQNHEPIGGTLLLDAVGGPAGMLLGGLAGAILGGLLGGAAGSIAGGKVGDVVDEKVLGNLQCGDCGHEFSDR